LVGVLELRKSNTTLTVLLKSYSQWVLRLVRQSNVNVNVTRFNSTVVGYDNCEREGMKMKTIKFIIDKNGNKRAYIMYPRQMRWFPIALVRAELLLATDDLVEVHNA